MIKLATPVIPVRDSAAAEKYYCGGLGFTLRSTYRPDPARVNPAYLSVERDGIWLHLDSFSAAKAGAGNVFFSVENVDELHTELLGRGVEIQLPPTDQTWGNREIMLKDPDQNGITFAQVGASKAE